MWKFVRGRCWGICLGRVEFGMVRRGVGLGWRWRVLWSCLVEFLERNGHSLFHFKEICVRTCGMRFLSWFFCKKVKIL